MEFVVEEAPKPTTVPKTPKSSSSFETKILQKIKKPWLKTKIIKTEKIIDN